MKSALERSREDFADRIPPRAELPHVTAARAVTFDPDDYLKGAYSIAASPDGSSVFVASVAGLARFDGETLEPLSAVPYSGTATSPGFADVATGQGQVVCVDLDGTLFGHDPLTCELLVERPYQPSVVEPCQRIIAGQLRKYSAAIVGLEGSFGGGARLAIGDDAVYLGGKDGVVTAHTPGSLNIISRAQLSEGPQSLGIRVVYMAPSARLYCGALSTLHVLTPGLQSIAKLRGGPKQPVFGNFCSVVESNDGRLTFSGDLGGPAVHAWETNSWSWLFRIELAAGGGPGWYLAMAPDDAFLFVSTQWQRFLAFSIEKQEVAVGRSCPFCSRCVEEGGGGGPLAVLPHLPDTVVVLSQRRLIMRSI